jgi:hypothetical protein
MNKEEGFFFEKKKQKTFARFARLSWVLAFQLALAHLAANT